MPLEQLFHIQKKICWKIELQRLNCASVTLTPKSHLPRVTLEWKFRKKFYLTGLQFFFAGAATATVHPRSSDLFDDPHWRQFDDPNDSDDRDTHTNVVFMYICGNFHSDD